MYVTRGHYTIDLLAGYVFSSWVHSLVLAKLPCPASDPVSEE
jgi:hypothetical protein